jgi:hypothetical protein
MTKRCILCECTDQLCPCKGICGNIAGNRLYRKDMEDTIGIVFCYICANDALNSGLFTVFPVKASEVQANQDQI